MRTVFAVALLCFAAAPCLAQEAAPTSATPAYTTPDFATPMFATPTFLKREPYFLPPSSVVFIDNGTCGVGKVLKVTGALGAIRRKKVCVAMGREEASRTFATP